MSSWLMIQRGGPLIDADPECVQRDKWDGYNFRFRNREIDLLPYPGIDPDGSAKWRIGKIDGHQELFLRGPAKEGDHMLLIGIMKPDDLSLLQRRMLLPQS